MTENRKSIITSVFSDEQGQAREQSRLLNTHDSWTAYLLSDGALDDLADKIARRWRDNDLYNLPIDEYFTCGREQSESEFDWPMMVEWYLLQPPQNQDAIKVLFGAFEKAYADEKPELETHGETFFYDIVALRRLNPLGDNALKDGVLNLFVSTMENLYPLVPAADQATYNSFWRLYAAITDAIYVEQHNHERADRRCMGAFHFDSSFYTILTELEQQRMRDDTSPMVTRYQATIDRLFNRLWMLNFDENDNLYLLEDGTRDNYMQTQLDMQWFALSLMVSPSLGEKAKQAQTAIANTTDYRGDKPGGTIRRYFGDAVPALQL